MGQCNWENRRGEKLSQKTTNDDGSNTGDNETIRKYMERVFTIEEERNTSEYQETMNLDIENIANTSQQIWISIYEVIDDLYFKAVNYLQHNFQTIVKKKETNLKT